MANDKLNKLARYVEEIKAKLSSPVPSKHTKSPETYLQFLHKELSYHSKKLEDLRLSEPTKK